jgi:hypothetical protein
MSALRIENAIDMHCHFGPDSVGGKSRGADGHSVTALDAAREAQASGHRALVLKSHSFASPQVAANMSAAVPGLQVFGGVCTDYPSGGLNVDVVDVALRLGARIVWLPTVHSHQDWLNGKAEMLAIRGDGLHVVDETGEPTEAVRAIFDLVRQSDAILATGHTTAAEHYAVIKAFAREGKLLVTHAGEELAGPHLTPAQCAELADLGATIELTALSCDHVMGCQGRSPAEMAAMIRTIGHERCTLSTDYGWTNEVAHPAAGLQDFLERLWAVGLSEAELTQMAAVKPAELLGL